MSKPLLLVTCFFLSLTQGAFAEQVTFNMTGVRCTPENEADQIIEVSTVSMSGFQYPGKGTGSFRVSSKIRTIDSYIYSWESVQLEIFSESGIGELRGAHSGQLFGKYHCVDFRG
jgi:hypothetical protein